MGVREQGDLRLIEDWIRAVLRLGSEVYLRSERTGKVWILLPHPKGGYVGQPVHHDQWLSLRQVNFHIKNKPHNFSTICPKHPTT